MEDDRKKISFSIPSKPKPPRPTAHTANDVSCAAGEGSTPSPAPHFITEFDPSKTLNPATPTTRVIAPLPNTFRIVPRRDLAGEPSADVTSGKEEAVPAVSAAAVSDVSTTKPGDSSAKTPYGLTLRGGLSAAPGEKTLPPHAGSPIDPTLRRYKEDMAALPDHRGMDEFRDVPVDAFGTALLAGYGWSEGKGIGRNNEKGDVKVVEYNGWVGSRGLGYNPSKP